MLRAVCFASVLCLVAGICDSDEWGNRTCWVANDLNNGYYQYLTKWTACVYLSYYKCIADDDTPFYGHDAPASGFHSVECGENDSRCCDTDLCNTNSTYIQPYIDNPNKEQLAACYETNLTSLQAVERFEKQYIDERVPRTCAWYTATCTHASNIAQTTFGRSFECIDDDDDVFVAIGLYHPDNCSSLAQRLQGNAAPSVTLKGAECCNTAFCLPSFYPQNEVTSTTLANTNQTPASNATTCFVRGWGVWFACMTCLASYALCLINFS